MSYFSRNLNKIFNCTIFIQRPKTESRPKSGYSHSSIAFDGYKGKIANKKSVFNSNGTVENPFNKQSGCFLGN